MSDGNWNAIVKTLLENMRSDFEDTLVTRLTLLAMQWRRERERLQHEFDASRFLREIADASLRVAELAEAGEFVFRSAAAAEAMAKLRKAHEAAGDLCQTGCPGHEQEEGPRYDTPKKQDCEDLDTSPCMGCGIPVQCVPEGLALCNDCAKENR